MITVLMTGEAYCVSAEIAAVKGYFEGFPANREGMLEVIRLHREYLSRVPSEAPHAGLLEAARARWQQALNLGEHYGYRNAQVTVLVPTGTISFLIDCDATGIEPDLALIKYKRLVGGGGRLKSSIRPFRWL